MARLAPRWARLPRRSASTPSVRPISDGPSFLPLKANADVREMTRSPGRLESLLMRLSEIPSLRYSFPGSPVAFSNGSTATEPTAPPRVLAR